MISLIPMISTVRRPLDDGSHEVQQRRLQINPFSILLFDVRKDAYIILYLILRTPTCDQNAAPHVHGRFTDVM